MNVSCARRRLGYCEGKHCRPDGRSDASLIRALIDYIRDSLTRPKTAASGTKKIAEANLRSLSDSGFWAAELGAAHARKSTIIAFVRMRQLSLTWVGLAGVDRRLLASLRELDKKAKHHVDQACKALESGQSVKS